MDDLRRVRKPADIPTRLFIRLTMPCTRYLIIPALYDSDPKLRFSKGVLSIFVVALMTAGYSFTALLCFACRDEIFQAEAIFLYEPSTFPIHYSEMILTSHPAAPPWPPPPSAFSPFSTISPPASASSGTPPPLSASSLPPAPASSMAYFFGGHTAG